MSGKTRQTVGSIFSVVGTVLINTGGLSWVGWLLIAAGAALSYDGQRRQQREAERRARAGNRPAAVRGNVRSSHEHHLMVFGKSRVGGTVVAVGTENGPDAPNQYLYLAIAHSITHAGGCEGITDIWLDDTRIFAAQITGDPNTAARDVTGGDFNGLVRVRHQRGTGTQAADSDLVAAGIDGSTNYRRGVAYTWVRIKKTTDDELFRRLFRYGLPVLSVELKGVRCYDPRKDSTNGGSGAHRYTDATTWEWSDNAILCTATYAIMDESDGGYGRPATGIDWPSVISAANVCDETKSVPGGSRARFICNGVLSTADKKDVNLQKLLDSCNGKKVTVGGKWKFYAAVYRTPVTTITQDWSAGPIKVFTKHPIESNYNAVRVNFDDQTQDYKTVDAPPYTSSTYETQDGGERVWQDLNLPMVSHSYDAQYLAQIHHKRSRYQMIVSMVCNLRALDVETWETVYLSLDNLQSPVRSAIAGKVFRIVHWRPTRRGIELTMQEEHSSIYTVDTMTVPNTGSAPTVGLETPQVPQNVQALAVADGILLTFNYIINLAERIQVERASSSGGSFSVIGSAPNGTTMFLDRDVAGGTWYYKLRARSPWGTLGSYSAEVSATAKIAADTGAVTLQNGAFEGGDRDWTKGTGWTIVLDASNARGGSWIGKLPGTGASQSVHMTNDRRVPITPGTIVDAYAFFKSTASANGSGKVRIRWLDSSLAELSTTDGNTVSGGTTSYSQSRAIAAAPSSAAYAQLQTRVESFSSSSSEAWYTDDCLMVVTPKEPYNLTVAGSGQRLGDQRNEPVITGVNRSPTVQSANPLTSSDAGTTATISVAAHNIQLGSGTISYNSGSVTGLSFDTIYYVYTDDPTYAGGAVTYAATTSAQTVTANIGRYYVGSLRTVMDGGGGGDPEPPCVAAHSWLADGLLARDAGIGDLLDCMDEAGAAVRFPIGGLERLHAQPCQRIELAGGAACVVSQGTPLTLRGGRIVMVADLRPGMQLAALYHGELRWEPVVKVDDVGCRMVQRIHVAGLSYAAGESAAARVLTHNPVKP